MMPAILYFIFGFITSFDLGIYAGGCAVSTDSLYYVGGALGEGESDLSPYTLTLNLSKGFKIDDQGNAPWTTIQFSQGGSFFQSKYPSVVFFDDLNSIVMYGGKGIDEAKSLQMFDTTTQTWNVVNNAEKSWASTFSNSSTTMDTFYQFTLTKNDNRVKNFIMYGGLSSLKGPNIANGVVRNLNSAGPVWSTLPGIGPKVYGHGSAIFNGALFIIGGVNAVTGDLLSMKTIPRYDILNGVWNNATAQGDIPEPRTLHSFTQANSMFYVAGGSSNKDSFDVISDELYTLDLYTLSWTRVTVKGFQGTVSGCLSYHNGILFSSFGYRNQPLSNLQLIDTSSWKMLKQSPPGGVKASNTSSGTSLSVIIGSIVGSLAFAGILLSLLTFFLIRRKRQREAKEKENELRPPELLQGYVWSNHQVDSSPLDFLNETQVPNFENQITRSDGIVSGPNDLRNSASPLFS